MSLPEGMTQTGRGRVIRRPSWRHPLQRLQWWRRHGKAGAIGTVQINVDTKAYLAAARKADRKVKRLDKEMDR